MVGEIDRWRTAQLLVKQHSLGASLEAAQRADEAIEAGDPKGERLWRDVMSKILQLQRTKRPPELLN